jgi:hypothetical protein
MKNKKPIPKELIPAFSYPDDENYIYDSLSPITTQEIGGQYFNLITIDNICKFFEYFIEDDDALNRYLEKFLSETISQNSLVKTFFQDKKGWNTTSFNSVINKFNNTNLGCHELHFCRESFLRSIDFTSLYRNLDTVAFLKAVKIRHDYDCFIEDILDLKYYLETGINLRSTSSVKKSFNKKSKMPEMNCTSRSPSRFTKMIKSLKAKPEYDSWEKLWSFLYSEASKGSLGNQAFRADYEFSEFEVKQNTQQQEISFRTVESKEEGEGSSMRKTSFKNAYNKA